MGREAQCEARFGKQTSRGKALLETSELLFRGDFRVSVPFKEMTRISADASKLTVAWSGGTLTLALGAEAARWAEKIRNPPSLLDKLGVKPASTVALVAAGGDFGGGDLDDFVAELAARAVKAVQQKPTADTDLLFFAIERQTDLRLLPKLLAALRPDAGLWVLRPKGSAAVSEADVRNAGLAAGLVDIKVAAFSPTRTAEKFVVPVARRPGARKKSAARRK
ncbi:MAG TPA: hypothetical protein VFH68_14110 [Polyangia bacterium]|jgi:hypothetical protein|nr:hypothetical protein [Polyangia bacterium]